MTRFALLAGALAGLAALRIPYRPSTLCLLRGTTGIPCPFCGATTAGVHLGHGDLAGALHASPLAVAMCAGFVAVPVLRRSRLTVWWAGLPTRWRQIGPIFVILPILAAAEVWQLFRFGIV